MTLKILRSLALTALALAASLRAEPLPQQAPPTEASPEWGGIVLRLLAPSDAQAPRHIHVSVWQASGALLISRSLRGGHLELGGIRPGDYRLQIEVDGYQTVHRSVQRAEFVGATLYLTVPLRPDKKAGYPASGLKSVIDADTLRVPDKAMRQLEKAGRASDAGRLKKAMGHLDKAIRIHPDFHQAYNNRAALYLRLHDYSKAEPDLLQALQIQPSNPNALRNLGWLLLAQGRYEEAAERLQELSELKPQDAWPQTFLGESLFQLRRYPEAAARFRRALELDPDAYVASYRLGAICLHRHDKQGALGHWRQFLRTNQGIDDPSIEERVRQLESEQPR